MNKRYPDQFEMNSIPQSERDSVFEEIDRTIAMGKIPINDSSFLFTAIKNDRRFPLLVNIIALVLIIGLGSFLYISFDSAEEKIVSAAENLNLTENQLIDLLKAESEQKLSEKESEIIQIEEEMNKILEEQALIVMESRNEINRLEAALRENLSRELVQEQENLQSQDLSPEMLKEEFAALELRMEERFLAERQKLVLQKDEEQRQKEAVLNNRILGYQETLEQARQDQNLIVDSLSREYDEMQSLFRSENERALLQYKSLQEFNEKEDFILNQISERYREVTEAISASDRELAMIKMEELEDFLLTDEISDYPAIRARKNTDMVLIRSLRSLIKPADPVVQAETQEPEIRTAEESALTVLLTEIGEEVEQGDRFYQTANPGEARKYYQNALSLIPPLENSYKKLQDLEQRELEERRTQYIAFLREGDLSFSENSVDDAIRNYTEALNTLSSRDENIPSIIAKLLQAGAAIEKRELRGHQITDEEFILLNEAKSRIEKRLQLLNLLEGLEKDAVLLETAELVEEDEELVKLLSTKVLIKEVLASRKVRSEYPDLDEKLESYLNAYGTLRESDGRTEILSEINKLMEKIEEGEAYYPASPLGKEQTKLYRQLLSHMQGIIEKTD